MKINDILDCVNGVLESERVIRNLDVRGHFVATIEVKRSMGPYKQAYVNIIYVDTANKTSFPFVTSSTMERALIDHMDVFLETASKHALVKFIYMCHEKDNWEKLIEGKYGTE